MECFLEKGVMGLERAPELLLQRTQFSPQHSPGATQLSITPGPGVPVPSSDVISHQAHM